MMNRIAIDYAKRVGAGRSAEARYKEHYRAWRARTRLLFLLAVLPIPLIMLLLSFVFPQWHMFTLGTAVGSTFTFVVTSSLLVPDRIDWWRQGAEAERRTARRLRHLARRGWTVVHDLPERYGNRDHVAVAPSGEVFLLDTKWPGGTITVTDGVLRVRWLEDPEEGYERDLTAKMLKAGERLAVELGKVLQEAPSVRPVVVIWGRWEGNPHVHKGVAWVHGKLVAQRLEANVSAPDPARYTAVVRALTATSTAKPRTGLATGLI